MKRRYKILFFIIGVGGIVALAINANPDRMDWMDLFTPKLPILFAGLLVLWAVIYGVHSRVYRLILGDAAAGLKPAHLYRICVAGFALNSVTPAGLLGGEPYRIMELRRYMPTEKATSGTLTFSLFYVMGHVLLWLTGILVYFLCGCPGDTVTTVLLAAAAAVLAAACAAFFRPRHGGLVIPALNFFSRLPLVGKKAAAYAEKNARLCSDIDEGYMDFCADKKPFRKAVAFEYIARLLECAEYYLIFLYLGEDLRAAGAVLVFSMASLLGNLLFMVPMQAGTREGGMTLALTMLAIDPATGLMGALIYRVREIVCILAGLICILLGGSEKE